MRPFSRPAVLAPILACLAASGCSSSIIPTSLPTDGWLCIYQLGDKYRNEAIRPDVVKYDFVDSGPIRRTKITYMLPANPGETPASHSLTCESAPWGVYVIAEDEHMLGQPQPSTYPTDADQTPTAIGPLADKVEASVRGTGIHVHIPGVDSF